MPFDLKGNSSGVRSSDSKMSRVTVPVLAARGFASSDT